MASLTGIQIISLVGYQGSGKSTIGKKLSRALSTAHIETSDLVRALHKNLSSKKELASTGTKTKKDPNWLGLAVSDCIEAALKELGKETIVLTGVREPQVHNYLQKRGAHLWSLELQTDAPVRYHRLVQLGKITDPIEFLDQEIREKKLGLDKLMDDASFMIKTTDSTSPDELTLRIIERLKEKGLK